VHLSVFLPAPRHVVAQTVTSQETRGDPVDLWDPGRGIALACGRGEKAVLSRTPAAEASVAVDVYAQYAEHGPAQGPAISREAFQRGEERPVETLNKRRASSRAERLQEKPRGRSRAKSRVGAATPASSSEDRPAASASPVRVSTLTDQELLEGLRAQSEPHFAELYSRYFQRIYNFVYARIRNHVECEEIVQETFIAVFRSFENYRGQSSLLSWIYGIAKNTTNNSLRRARTQNERIDLVEESELVPSSSLAPPSPDELYDLHRFGDELSVRLEQVADWQAEIFSMRHFDNLSIPEISRRTNRTSDAVRSSLYRVKRIFFEAALPGSAHHASDHGAPAEDEA
jgi:RNA polymerase sigma-70 factor (ECF subfamily)